MPHSPEAVSKMTIQKVLNNSGSCWIFCSVTLLTSPVTNDARVNSVHSTELVFDQN